MAQLETAGLAETDATPASEASPAASKSRIFYWLIAFAIAGIFLYYSLRGIEWSQVWAILRTARLDYIALCCVISSGSLWLRSLRWRVLLQAEGRVQAPLAFWATAAGYFGNNFLPARGGEIVRTMMVSSQAGLGRIFVLTTALSERLVDAIVLVTISSLVLLALPVRPGWLNGAARPFAVVGLSAALAIAILPKLDAFWKLLLARLPVPHRFRDKMEHLLDQILVGLRSFHSFDRLSRFLGLTLLIWPIDALATVVGARALGLSFGFALAFLLISGLGLGSALPSTPGYVGIYQFVAVEVLVPFGFSRTDAIAYILLAQALQYAVIGFWGLLGILRYRRFKTAKV